LVGQMATQCPQAIQPKIEVFANATLLFSILKLKSLQTSTHDPQPMHKSGKRVICAFSFVLLVGIAI